MAKKNLNMKMENICVKVENGKLISLTYNLVVSGIDPNTNETITNKSKYTIDNVGVTVVEPFEKPND